MQRISAKQFRELSGYEQGKVILAGLYRMPRRWAREFRAEQGRYHIAYWTSDAWKLWNLSSDVLGI